MSDKRLPTPSKTRNKTLDTVVDDFMSAWDYTSSSWHDRWTNNYKQYNNQRVNPGYDGITNTFIPMVYSTVETMTAALFGNKPKFDFIPPNSKKDQKTDILNAALDYYWDKDQWSLKVINTGRSMFNLGTAVDYFMWHIDHPVMINIPIRDFFIDPTATSIDNARFCGRRYLTTKKELESFQVVDFESDEDTPQLIKRYKNLDKVTKGSTTAQKTDKEEKDYLYGSTLSDTSDQVEVIEYWTLEKTISVANRSVVIEDSKNWYLARAEKLSLKNPKGLLPFADARDVVDPSLFYAKGETDFITDLQELLNDISNQNIDSITFTLNQMYTLDPKYADKINEVENIPGAVYPFEAGTLVPIPQRSIPPDAFNERMNIKNEIRETTASNEVVKGVGQQNSGTTATEINAQIAGAGQRLNLKVTQIENGYFHRVAKIVFQLMRLNITEPMLVRIMGKDGARWEEFDPSEYREGEYEPRIQLDITIENHKQQRASEAKEMLAAFLNDPDVNQRELKTLVLQRSYNLDPDEVNLLMDNSQQMPGLPGDLMAEGPPPEMPMGAMPPELPPELPPEPQQLDPAGIEQLLVEAGI